MKLKDFYCGDLYGMIDDEEFEFILLKPPISGGKVYFYLALDCILPRYN